MHAVVIGGTRFIGRHAVEEFLEHGYHVTLVNRGEHENPFAGEPKISHVRGDRNDRRVLKEARDKAVPDVVIDCIALVPQQVATAIDVFEGVDAYVYISSIAAYERFDLPQREGETPLEPFTSEHAVDDPRSIEPMKEWASYGPRKAECDRVCFAATEDGANAVVVRPTYVFGPYDYTERFDYWIDRLVHQEEVLVPDDGDNLVHHVFVEDVASALRMVAERGKPGEAYNVGARRFVPLDEQLTLIAEALDREVELVYASRRELAEFGLEPSEFPLVRPRPVVVDTAKLTALGWDSTLPAEAVRSTVEEHVMSNRTGRHHGPDRDIEQQAINKLTS